jgi:hypothetical protein
LTEGVGHVSERSERTIRRAEPLGHTGAERSEVEV